MMNTNKVKYFLACCLIVGVLSFTGCATVPDLLEPLQTDSFSELTFQSILLGRVHMVSKTGMIRHYAFRLYFDTAVDDSWTMADFRIDDEAVEGLREEGRLGGILSVTQTSGFDVPFHVEIQAGGYRIQSVALSPGNNSQESFKVHNPTDPMFSITPQSLNYFGVIEIESLPQDRYRFTFKDEIEDDLKAFQDAYPHLYEQLKENVYKVGPISVE